MKKAFMLLVVLMMSFAFVFSFSSCGKGEDAADDEIVDDGTTDDGTTVCDHVESDVIIENAVDADCENAGSYDTVVYCAVCSAELSREIVTVDARGHTAGDAATCTTSQFCTVCGAELNPALGHGNTEIINDREATEDETGYTGDTYCNDCETTIANGTVIPPLGHTHTMSLTAATEATCTENGNVAYYICSGCGLYYLDEAGENQTTLADTVISAPGHTAGDAATCTTAQLCTVCTAELAPALGHKNTEVKNSKEATDDEAGYTGDTYCNDCESTIATGTIIPELDHVHVMSLVAATEATCTEDGNVAYYTCSGCGLYYLDEAGENQTTLADTVISALGHTAGDAVVENSVAADCENAGSYDSVVYCSVCGAEISRETVTVDALGHTAGAAATCTTAQSCTVCGEELVAALGHNAADAVVENEVDADCVNAGSYDSVVYCDVCGEELSRETVTVDALGHTAADAVVENEVDADCENAGSYDSVVYCSVCGAEISRETVTVDALGHTAGAAATCTTPQICTVCGEVLDLAKGHSYGDDGKCSACGDTVSGNLDNDHDPDGWTSDDWLNIFD